MRNTFPIPARFPDTPTVVLHCNFHGLRLSPVGDVPKYEMIRDLDLNLRVTIEGKRVKSCKKMRPAPYQKRETTRATATDIMGEARYVARTEISGNEPSQESNNVNLSNGMLTFDPLPQRSDASSVELMETTPDSLSVLPMVKLQDDAFNINFLDDFLVTSGKEDIRIRGIELKSPKQMWSSLNRSTSLGFNPPCKLSPFDEGADLIPLPGQLFPGGSADELSPPRQLFVNESVDFFSSYDGSDFQWLNLK
eukprot:gb/GEZN01005208.1/.p1 GENE.gb/GEZN01005208.1/~~gb/GEZN01005208.1/.p1  ORF type:complete len:251 (+),score=18.60 gb/GEZN01005208.1/:312-1064(+)